MAMNKKEQAAFDALKNEIRLAKALRWTEPVSPNIPVPDYQDGLTKGFLYNAYLGSSWNHPRVEPACSSSINHNFGSNEKTTTQGSRELYSTRLLALKALRYDVEIQCATALARIDEQIEKESQKVTAIGGRG